MIIYYFIIESKQEQQHTKSNLLLTTVCSTKQLCGTSWLILDFIFLLQEQQMIENRREKLHNKIFFTHFKNKEKKKWSHKRKKTGQKPKIQQNLLLTYSLPPFFSFFSFTSLQH